MILTSGMLQRELGKLTDDFLTVEIDGKEYVIEKICRRKNYTDAPLSHLSLICRDGGSGEVKR